jgi:hypothetical protein
MKKWFDRNLRNIIATAFVIPILLVAFVSISHVTSFYGLSNPISWALYLSVGIEIAAISALAAVSVRMGNFIYFPFIIVTLIQMVGNIFFSFSFIDEASEGFKDWISMVGGLFENMGIDKTDISSHKLILSFLTGGLLPIISLTFAHMLVKFSEQNKTVVIEEVKKEEKTEVKEEPKDLSEEIDEGVYEEIKNKFIEKKLMEERDLKYKPTQDDLDKLDEFLKNINYQGPKFEESKDEKINPNQEDLDKLEEVLNQYSNIEEPLQEIVEEKPENDIVYTIQEETETIEEDEIEKVFFNPEESEVLYSDDSKTVETIDIGKSEQEIKPEPIEMVSTTKVLNYFKRND